MAAVATVAKVDETVEQPADLEQELRRRARRFRRLRIAVLALVVGYFFLPYDIRTWIPVWLPFLAALGLETDFFVGGWLKGRSGEAEPSPLGKHGPQPRDLADFGGPSWQEAFTVEHDGEQILVPAIGAPTEEDGGSPTRTGLSLLRRRSAGRSGSFPGPPTRSRRAPRSRLVAGHPLLRRPPARLERRLVAEPGPRRGALLTRGGEDRRPPGDASPATRAAASSASPRTPTASRSSAAARLPRARSLRHALPARLQAPRAVVPADRRGRSPSSRTSRGTCTASRTRGSPTATPSRAASASASTSACRRRPPAR